MKIFRTIIIILGILVAGAAFNITFAQKPVKESKEETFYSSRHDHPKFKHKDKDAKIKHKNKEHKNKEFKNKEFKNKEFRNKEAKHAHKADMKGYKHKTKEPKQEAKAYYKGKPKKESKVPFKKGFKGRLE